MSIYIGNQTAFFTADPEEPFVFAVKNGFTAFEWFSDKKHYDDGGKSGWGYQDVTDRRAEQLKNMSLKYNIRYSIHASCNTTPFSAEGIRDITEAFVLADKMGAKVVNIHLVTTEGIGNFVRAIKPVIDIAAQYDIALAIENTPLHSPEDFNQLFCVLKEQEVLSRAKIGMCLDIGHANCCEATRNDYISFIDRLDSEVAIIHCHVHENWGDSDSHLALFTGPSKDNDSGVRLFIERMKARKYTGSMIMEQWPQDHEILNNVFSRLVYMIGEQAVQRKKICDVIPELAPEEAESSDEEEKVTGVQGSGSALTATAIFERDPSKVTNYYKRVRAKRKSTDWAIDEIISFSKVRKSWRRRLEGIKDLFLTGKEFSMGDLAAVSAYLRFLSTAEIPCVEDGGHYRPCHHARAAQDIEEAIERIKTSENSWIVRKIYPYLPSHADEFMRHEPLTRIRDIAHRNDIPKDMKLDIKHNLQNKLHRSAGPEDLVTAKRILEKINSDAGAYSASFVNEYKLFYQELLEFFNAAGLESRLDKISDSAADLKEDIAKFIEVKNSAEALARVGAGVILRQKFADYLKENSSDIEVHIADCELEDFAFAAISEAFNRLENTGKLTAELFELLELTFSHILLNNYNIAELKPLRHEFSAWKEEYFCKPDRLVLLRIWASMQRGLRFCAGFADLVTGIFATSVIEFGKAFKIPPHAVNMYCEGDIRANIIFQLSKILGKIGSILMSQLDFSPWSVINGGKARGEVVVSDNIREFEGKTGNYIVLLRKAEGDEELPAAVRAVLLAHPLGHLSHLGVRARSGRVPFAAAENISVFEALEELAGSEHSFEFTEDGITEVSGDDVIAGDDGMLQVIEIPPVTLSSEITVLSAVEIVRQSCGGKAAASAKMFNDLDAFNSFSVPRVMAIPYGVMELCLAEQEELRIEYQTKVDSLQRIADSEFESKLAEIRNVIERIKLPENLITKITDYFGEDVVFAVRSSSSGEDLEGFAGAGLYESVIGVREDKLEESIRKVWSSLWTPGAALSRKKYSIGLTAVYMGVLIQEVVEAEYSFVMHTANSVTGNNDEMSIELAAGFGETLASANQPGTPCRIMKDLSSGSISVEKCADISNRLVLDKHGAGLVAEPVDYADFTAFTGDKLLEIAGVLCGIAKELENYFKMPQDIEGAYSNGNYYIVQSRAQAGIKE